MSTTALRRRLGLTQGRLAELVGVHPMTVSKWERGELSPSRWQRALLRVIAGGTRAPAAVAELTGLLNRALVDASEVPGMRLSASNLLKGKIVQIEEGPVSTRVVLEIAPKVRVTSVITTASSRRLGLRLGKSCTAIIKATEVILGVS